MSDPSTAHATFTVVRDYRAAPARVWRAFAELDQKQRWFGEPGGDHVMDFSVGGEEVSRGVYDGTGFVTRVRYLDLVPERRIVHAYTMDKVPPDQLKVEGAGRRISASLQTIELAPTDEGCRVTLTEQGVFLDNLDQVALREHGTRWLLDQIAVVVED